MINQPTTTWQHYLVRRQLTQSVERMSVRETTVMADISHSQQYSKEGYPLHSLSNISVHVLQAKIHTPSNINILKGRIPTPSNISVVIEKALTSNISVLIEKISTPISVQYHSLSNKCVLIGKISTPFSVQYQSYHRKDTHSILCPISMYSLEIYLLNSLSNSSVLIGKMSTPFSVQYQSKQRFPLYCLSNIRVRKDTHSILCTDSVFS